MSFEQLKQQKEIAEADLEGLEECPFCDYKCVMDVDKTREKLFICRNYDGGCGAISCRECRHPVRYGSPSPLFTLTGYLLQDHSPKSCKGWC